MTIQFFAKLSAKGTSTYATDKAAEDRAGNCAEADASRSCNSADSGTELAASQRSACATSCAANGADSGASFHGGSK
jgi:hypothetical protein